MEQKDLDKLYKLTDEIIQAVKDKDLSAAKDIRDNICNLERELRLHYKPKSIESDIIYKCGLCMNKCMYAFGDKGFGGYETNLKLAESLSEEIRSLSSIINS